MIIHKNIYLTPSHEIPKSRCSLLLNAAMSSGTDSAAAETVSEDSCSWSGVEEMLDMVGVGASTNFLLGLYTNGLGVGAGVSVTERDSLLLDSASVDVDGDWAVVSSRGGVVVRVAAEGEDTEEDGESASLSDLDLGLFPPNTVELRGGRNRGVDRRSMLTSGGAGILMVKLGTVGTSSSTVTGVISVAARVDSVTSDSKAK